MAEASIKSLTEEIEKALEGMVKRANMIPAYLNRVVYREYQNAQRKRWETENAGDDFAGGQWQSLDLAYATWKKKKYAGYPGGGTKILIRTNRLFSGVVGPGADHRKIVDDRSIRIATAVPYGQYVDNTRTFSQWSPVFYNRIYKDLGEYLFKAILKGSS